MLRFITGFAVVWAALLAWALLDQRDWFWAQAVGQQWPFVAAKLLGLPVAVGWFTADLLERRRPRRLFDARVRRPMAPILVGALAAVIAVVLAAGQLAVLQTGLVDTSALNANYTDAAILGVSAAVSAGLALLALRRARPGTCIQCGYDLSGVPAGRCPECGAAGSMIAAA